MESRPGQVGLKHTLRGSEEIDPDMVKARLVIIGIDEGAFAASRHPFFLHASRVKPAPRKATMPAGIATEPKGRSDRWWLTMQIPEVAKENRYFFSVGGRRGAAALP